MYPVDARLYAGLAAADPADVTRRAICGYDPQERAYSISVWGDVYTVRPESGRIDCLRETCHEYFGVFLVNYLLLAQDAEPVGEWISEKDIPGGPTFFRGPHQVPTGWISDRFGDDIDAFARRCRGLGGSPLALADAAFSFPVTPRLPVAVLYWRGDADFPAEAKILYDRSLAGYLAADGIFALAVDVCHRLSVPVPRAEKAGR